MSSQGADVDEHVIAHVDTRDGDTGVDDHALTARLGANVCSWVAVLVLFGNEGRDAGLEEADTAAEQDQTDDERSECTALVGHNLRNRGDNDQDVANGGEADGDVNGLELSPVLIGNPAA